MGTDITFPPQGTTPVVILNAINTEYVSPDQYGGFYGTVYRTYFGTTLPSYLTTGDNISMVLDASIWVTNGINARKRASAFAFENVSNYVQLVIPSLGGKGNMSLGTSGFYANNILSGHVDYTK